MNVCITLVVNYLLSLSLSLFLCGTSLTIHYLVNIIVVVLYYQERNGDCW